MNIELAKELLSFHSCRNENIDDPRWENGFLGILRPFQGELNEKNFIEIMECLKVLVPEIQKENIDKNIEDYIVVNFFDPVWGSYLEEAIRGNLFLVELLINRGILDSLVFEQREISKGLLLLQSVICNESESVHKVSL